MKPYSYACRFTGRTAGSIGITYPCFVILQYDTEPTIEALTVDLYTTHEHIKGLTIMLYDGNIKPTAEMWTIYKDNMNLEQLFCEYMSAWTKYHKKSAFTGLLHGKFRVGNEKVKRDVIAEIQTALDDYASGFGMYFGPKVDNAAHIGFWNLEGE